VHQPITITPTAEEWNGNGHCGQLFNFDLAAGIVLRFINALIMIQVAIANAVGLLKSPLKFKAPP